MVNSNLLVDEHVGLVSKMAKQLMKTNTHCDWLTEDDLVNAGYEALNAAARNYDASRGVLFKTYATTSIRNAMINEIRKMFPVRIGDKQTMTSLVRNGDAEVDAEVWEQARRLEHDDWEQRKQKETVAEILGRLTPDERWLIRCYYGFDDDAMTLQGIADLLLVSPQTVHKRLKKVHDKLRKLVMDSHSYYHMCA
ncbi:MAG: sigma-70 family RNA polymerase sigma factor [Bacteroidales bacterium]|nr:sigma-70 family RNA polymerase sigma factor [Bacteroidales bacterium]